MPFMCNAAFVSAEEGEHVLTLDHSNFTNIVSKHNFIVVEFYAPWYVLVYIILLIYIIGLVYIIGLL